jgi:hypothetical protein
MRTQRFTLVLGISFLAACADHVAENGVDDIPTPTVSLHENDAPPGPHGKPEDPPQLGLHKVKGEAGGPNSSTNMTWHRGQILTQTVIQPIFWGTQWSDATFAGDKITGLDDFYGGLNGSPYARTNIEYTGSNGTVGSTVTYAGHVVDATATGLTNSPSTSAILAEVCKVVGTAVTANGYYPVYTDSPRKSAGYCGWHSYGSCYVKNAKGVLVAVPVQFGFFFALDNDAGCDPQDTGTTHSQGLAALANVSGHEYSETITDPRNGGWLDSKGNENGDKCAWSWPTGAPTVLTFSNGSQWKIQGNWSNAAFTGGKGWANLSNQAGCLFAN